MINLLLTMFLLLSSHSAYACYDSGQSDKANFDNCLDDAQRGDANAQFYLGNMYLEGLGVTQIHKLAVKWYRKAAEQGFAQAQYNLGVMYVAGQGVLPDIPTGVKWIHLAAKQGHVGAIKALTELQELNMIPPLRPGTIITTILLTSEAGAKYNNRIGIVVAPPKCIKQGRAAVLLDGESRPISFKLMNLQIKM